MAARLFMVRTDPQYPRCEKRSAAEYGGDWPAADFSFRA